MKNKKIKFLILAVALVMGVVGCTTDDTQYRNMQTRLNDNNDNGWLNDTGMRNNMPYDNDRLNTRLNNGMTRNNDLNNDMLDNNDMMNNGMYDNDNRNMFDNGNNDMYGNNNNMSNMNGNNNDMRNLSTRANKIAKRVANLSEVNSASVIISEDTAVVGIETKDRNMKNNISSDLRKKVEAAVKAGDKDIDKISITSDPDIYSRLKTMSRDMDNGNIISDFTNEVQDIIRRITTPNR